MSTGNLLLGYGRKSIGDITLYRTYGKQRARARNRNPKNPKTEKQQIQRAITATIAKAYSQMKAICDHSFQGKSVGAENQQEFNSVNMNLLRANLIADVNNETPAAQCLASVVKPNANFACLNPYIVSKGTLVNNLIELDPGEEMLPSFKLRVSSGSATQTIAEHLADLGVSAGDIFTILVQSDNGTYDYRSQYGQQASSPGTEFGFLRLTVKEPSTTILMSAAKMSDIFTFDSENITASLLDTVKNTTVWNTSDSEPAVMYITTPNSNDYGGVAVIRSRKDSGNRSNAAFKFVGEDAEQNKILVDYAEYGIKQEYLMNAWGEEPDTLGSSPLILEGGGF